MVGIHTSRNTFADGQYCPIQCGRAVSSSTLLNVGQSGGVFAPRSVSASIYGLRVSVKDAPGVGNSYTFEVYTQLNDGSPGSGIPIASGVSVTISGASTSGVSSGTSRVDPASLFAIKMSQSGAPSGTSFSSSVLFESNAQFTYLMGPRFFWANTITPGLFNFYGDENANAQLTSGRIMPCLGFIDQTYINLYSVGNTGFTRFYFYRNGIELGQDDVQGLYVVGPFGKSYARLPGASTSLGDRITLGFTNDYFWQGDGTTSSKFFPNVTGAFPLMGGIVPSGLSGTQFCSLNADAIAQGSNEDDFTLVLPQCVASNLVVYCPSVLGTSKSIAFTVRKNKADTALTCTVSGAFIKTAIDSTNSVAFAAGDLISLKLVSSGGPAPSEILVGVQLVAGAVSTSISSYGVVKQAGANLLTSYGVIAPRKTNTLTSYGVIDAAAPGSHGFNLISYGVIAPRKTTTVTSYGVVFRPELPSKGRVHALLNAGQFWDGPWLMADNGVIGPAPSTGFVPTDDPNLFAWFRSDRNLLLNGSNVATGASVWRDQSVYRRDLDSAAGTEPAYTAADTPSGKGAITFLAGGNKILAMPTSVVGLGQPWAHLLLVKATAWNANQYISDGGGVGQQAGILQSGVSPQVTAYSGNLGPNAGGLTLNVYHVLTVIFDGTNLVIQVDNGTDATGNVGTQIPARIRYGNYAGGGANGAAFRLAASILVSGHVSATMRAAHKQWLADYGGITL